MATATTTTTAATASAPPHAGGRSIAPSNFEPFWQSLRMVCTGFDPAVQRADKVAEHAEDYQYVLPCGGCRHNFAQVVKKYPPQKYFTDDKAVEWFDKVREEVRQHEATNLMPPSNPEKGTYAYYMAQKTRQAKRQAAWGYIKPVVVILGAAVIGSLITIGIYKLDQHMKRLHRERLRDHYE